ncbi:hypothetical protein EU97_0531 [Prochlorococcus marinus str. MIT 9311]|nr:hypothetical protein EU97_0531 [Prochlorococcus marinus str. MIT 9311]
MDLHCNLTFAFSKKILLNLNLQDPVFFKITKSSTSINWKQSQLIE